jgi:hypothetical protein
MTAILILFAIQAFVLGAALAEDGANPSVANIQRTLARMAASTPDKPATVRWMFYGQSITAQPWTRLVEQDLARRFPSVNFVFHKPAIGGFTSPALIRTAEHDLDEPQPPGTETVLVQNCVNGKHQLTLRGSAGRAGITAFRVYAPASVQHE